MDGMANITIMKKYGCSRDALVRKIESEGWKEERERIANAVYKLAKDELTINTLDAIKKRKEQVERLTTLALDRLENILQDETESTKNILVAIGKALEVSGLKAINGTFQEQAPKKIYITKIDEVKVNRHIEDVING